MNPFPILKTEFLGNTLPQWALALLAFAVTFLVLPLARGYINRLRKRMAATTHATGAELATVVASRTTRVFLWVVAVWVGVLLLDLPDRLERRFNAVALVAVWFQVGVWAMAAVGYYIDRQRSIAADRGLAGSLDLIGFLARVILWALVLLLALDNLGVEVTPLIAGLGITGIAVALAVQTVLGDLLASLSIALDKPFVVGDFLVVGGEMGAVEKIGVKSTRLRSLGGEQIVISNADLLQSRVRNYGRMYERRVVFETHVRYETPTEKVNEIPRLLEAAVRAQQRVRFDRAHLARFGDFSMVFETVYYVLTADYNLYMDIQQAINLRILDEFRQRDILFAYRDRLALHELPKQ